MKKQAVVFLLLLFSFLHASEAEGLYEVVSRYHADKSALERKYTLKESTEYYDRFAQFYDTWLDTLQAIEFDALSHAAKADHLLLKNLIEKERYFLRLDREAFAEVSFTVDFASPLYEFIRARRNGKRPDAPAMAKNFMNCLHELDSLKNKLQASKPFTSWIKAENAAGVVSDLAANLEEAFEFYYGYDPEFSWWAEKPYKRLYDSLKVYKKFLENYFVNTSLKDDGSGIVGKPIGREALIQSLQFELIPYGPERLVEMAEQQFAWCDREMLKASRELGFGDDWKAALEHVKNRYVPAGEQPALIDSLAWDAIRFVEQNDLISVPPLAKETWRMGMMTPEQQKINPFFLGGEQIKISYPTHTMDHDGKLMSMRGNNPHFAKATVHHELIPGHHMQLFMMQRHKPYRQLFNTPFWIEGWALYWEMNLWDKDYPASPEDRIGMLFWRMHRCARIIFSLNFHLGEMTPQECIDFLVDRVGHEYANAEAEVRRSFTGRYDPLYQIAYMIGGLQFRSLKSELVDSGSMTEKEFHDRILQEGSMPVEMVRAVLTRRDLKKDFSSSWYFLENL